MIRVMAAMALTALVLVAGCDDAERAEAERVAATPQALAAVALEHADIEPTLVEGSTEDGYIRASIEFDHGQQRLVVGAGEDVEVEDEPCDDRGSCDVISTDDGDVHLYWEDEEPEEDPGIISVTFETEDGLNGAYYAGDPITGDPRDLDLGVDVDDMVAIVTDDRFGTSTTKDMADAEVPGWAEEPTALTPQLIAHRLTMVHQTLHELAAYEVDASAYGEGSIGAGVEFEDGITITGYYVPDAEGAELCPTGWVCRPLQNGEILAGQPRNQVNDFSKPLELLTAFLSEDGYATLVVRDGIPLASYDPTEAMALQASVMADVDLVDAEDIAEIDAIWEER